MALTFNIKPHGVLLGVSIVEILEDGRFIGAVYPEGEKGIKLVSAHFADEPEIDEGFAGTVLSDDGTTSFPPIPSLSIEFEPSPYTIVGNRIVRKKDL
jgi:hypothetical protein